MTPQEYLQKLEAGALSEADSRQFLDSIQQKLVELKQQDPAKYLETVRNLNEAVEGINEALEAA